MTQGKEWYFSSVFDNTTQGQGIAAYVRTVLKAPAASIVASDDVYGKSLQSGFADSFSREGTVQANITISADPAKLQESVASAAAQITKIKNPGPIVLATLDTNIGSIAKPLNDAGVNVVLVGTDALSNPLFYKSISNAGTKYVNDALTATPLTRGTLTGAAVTFYHDFGGKFGYPPSWVAGMTYDAVDAFTESMQRGEIAGSLDAIAADRNAIKAELDLARTPETALPTLTGSLYFNNTDSAVGPVAFVSGRLPPDGQIEIQSAPNQLQPYSPTAGISLEQELASGGAVRFGDEIFTIQRIVSVGMNLNEVGELDAAAQTFYADFFVYFKYEGPGGAPTEATFVNAVKPDLALGPLQRKTELDGQTYELYRVTGEFKAQFDFAAFPFDHQNLKVVIQPKTLPASQLAYVVDNDNLAQTQDERLHSGVNSGSTINEIPNWQADSVQFYPSSVGNTSDLGDPTFIAGSQGITYSQFVADVDISRDVISFLIKNLLPLLLLVAVSYVGLWLPYKETGSRISFGATGILTGAVMLNSVTNSLPSVDYTVAIEWAYYAFIALSASCVLLALVGRGLYEQRRLAAVRVLDRSARIAYPAFVLAVAAFYFFTFGL